MQYCNGTYAMIADIGEMVTNLVLRLRRLSNLTTCLGAWNLNDKPGAEAS